MEYKMSWQQSNGSYGSHIKDERSQLALGHAREVGARVDEAFLNMYAWGKLNSKKRYCGICVSSHPVLQIVSIDANSKKDIEAQIKEYLVNCHGSSQLMLARDNWKWVIQT